MQNLVEAAASSHIVSGTSAVSLRGKWVKVPSVRLDGQNILITGRWLRVASLQDEDWVESELRNPEECARLMKNRGEIPTADILRFSQKVPDINRRYAFPMTLRSIAVARVGNFQTWWESLPQETRKNVRRSQKRGVSIELREFGPEMIEGIASIQNESPVRQGRAYPHYGKSLEQVKRDHGSLLDHSDFICALFEGEIIGFLKLVYRGDIAAILQLNSKIAHYDKRPSNALLSKAVELCSARGISHLTYGMFQYGNKAHSPLVDFKLRHGFEEMLVPNYHVPLTLRGSFCVKAGLHRGLLDVLPPSVISAALKARTKWYDFLARK